MSGKIIGCVTAFQQAGYDVTIYITQGAQDATRVATERAGEFDRMVCAGGDGTLNEVITGLMRRRPTGSRLCACWYDKRLRVQSGHFQVPARQRVVGAGRYCRQLDIGRFNDRYFNHIAAFGAFTEVSMRHRSRPRTFSGVLRISSRALRR